MPTPAAEPELTPGPSVCPRCGAGFRCGMVSGDAACWCTQLPPLLPVPSAGNKATNCFCPRCLTELTATPAT